MISSIHKFLYLGLLDLFKGVQLLGAGKVVRYLKSLVLGLLVFFLRALLAFCCGVGMWRDPGVPADSFYEIRPECTDVPISRFKIKVCFLSPQYFFSTMECPNLRIFVHR